MSDPSAFLPDTVESVIVGLVIGIGLMLVGLVRDRGRSIEALRLDIGRLRSEIERLRQQTAHNVVLGDSKLNEITRRMAVLEDAVHGWNLDGIHPRPSPSLHGGDDSDAGQ